MNNCIHRDLGLIEWECLLRENMSLESSLVLPTLSRNEFTNKNLSSIDT